MAERERFVPQRVGPLTNELCRMPWADLSVFEKNPRVQDFGNLLTVGDLCNYVNSKIG